MNRSIKDTPEHKEFWCIIDADRDMTTMTANTETRITILMTLYDHTEKSIQRYEDQYGGVKE